MKELTELTEEDAIQIAEAAMLSENYTDKLYMAGREYKDQFNDCFIIHHLYDPDFEFRIWPCRCEFVRVALNFPIAKPFQAMAMCRKIMELGYELGPELDNKSNSHDS